MGRFFPRFCRTLKTAHTPAATIAPTMAPALSEVSQRGQDCRSCQAANKTQP